MTVVLPRVGSSVIAWCQKVSSGLGLRWNLTLTASEPIAYFTGQDGPMHRKHI